MVAALLQTGTRQNTFFSLSCLMGIFSMGSVIIAIVCGELSGHFLWDCLSMLGKRNKICKRGQFLGSLSHRIISPMYSSPVSILVSMQLIRTLSRFRCSSEN